MVRSGLIFLFLIVSGVSFPHSDPGFMHGRHPFRTLLMETPAGSFCNPAFVIAPGRVHWLACVTNHHGIRSYNTLLLGIGTSTEKRSLSLLMKHASLSEAEYHRTSVNMGVNIQTGSSLYFGASLRCLHFRLPAHYGSVFHAGSMAGFWYEGSPRIAAGVAGGYYNAIGLDESGSSGITHLLAVVRYRPVPKSGLVISMEMLSNQRVEVLVAYKAEVNSRVRMMVGVGTGSEMVFAGIFFDMGKLRPLVISGFNPMTGSTNTFLVSGKYL